MSLRLKRRIVAACTAVATITVAGNAMAAISGHSGRFTAMVIVVDSIGVLSGLWYLYSTRGRP